MKTNTSLHNFLAYYFLFLLFVFDRIIKFFALNELVSTPWFSVFFNTKTVFSLFNTNWLTITVSLIIALILIALTIESNKILTKTALALISLGAISNIIDRIRYDAVIDYIHGPNGLIFNTSDVYITVGLIMLIGLELYPKPRVDK